MASVNNGKDKGILERFGLVTFKEGFMFGLISGAVLQLGIVTIVTPLQNSIVFLLFLLGIGIGFSQAFRRKSLLSPSGDGLVSGFGISLAIINFVKNGTLF